MFKNKIQNTKSPAKDGLIAKGKRSFSVKVRSERFLKQGMLLTVPVQVNPVQGNEQDSQNSSYYVDLVFHKIKCTR